MSCVRSRSLHQLSSSEGVLREPGAKKRLVLDGLLVRDVSRQVLASVECCGFKLILDVSSLLDILFVAWAHMELSMLLKHI